MPVSTIPDSRVLIDVRANDLAFHIGQWIARSLLDRSLEIVRQSGSSLVTTEHVEACVDHVLFDDLLKWMKEAEGDRTTGEEGVGSGQSRKAA
jgi:hypothetical protein